MGGGGTSKAAKDTQGEPVYGVRELTSIQEMRETEAIQREVWGLPDIDVVPASQLRAAAHAGGHVAGAFVAGAMVGFAYGLVATPHGAGMEGVGLHSHMVAVREQGRQRGTGRALKWFQRQWCLDRGMSWMTWTFDPLQSRNANLNFAHLGVVSREYLVDFYGAMSGPLGGDASDRLVALWLLDSQRVRQRAAADLGGGGSTPPKAHTAAQVSTQPGHGLGARKAREAWILRAEDVESPHDSNHVGDATEESVASRVREALADAGTIARLLVATPADVGRLRSERPGTVARWRDGIRAAIPPALEAGYEVVGFVDGAYVLEPGPT